MRRSRSLRARRTLRGRAEQGVSVATNDVVRLPPANVAHRSSEEMLVTYGPATLNNLVCANAAATGRLDVAELERAPRSCEVAR